MIRHLFTGLCGALGVCAGVAFLPGTPSVGAERAANAPLRIGLCASLFPDVPDANIKSMSKPFNKAMSAETGMTGELLKEPDPLRLAKQLNENGVQIGVFTSHEFAWARERQMGLKPLAIAVSGSEKPQALVVVLAGAKVKQWSDLQGLALSRPKASKPHALLYLDRRTREAGKEPKDYFARITVNTESSESLDDVVEGASQAALVDNVVWAWYQKNKPKRTAQLRVALASEKFPAAVVAYNPTVLEEATVQKFRKGLLHAHENESGKDLMGLWQIKDFEDPPADYEESLKEILRAYPPPTGEKSKEPAK